MALQQVTPHIRIGDTFSPHGHERYLIDTMRHQHVANPRDYMYGSTAGFCPRQNFIYNKMDSLEVETTPESTLYMEIGSGIELALSNSLYKKGRLFFSNLRLPRVTPDVSGKIDLVYLDEHDHIVIGEVKSCGKLPTKPKYAHMQQLLTYLAFAGYKKGRLIYVSRNVTDRRRILIKVFEADVTPASMLRILKKVCYTQLAMNADVMPNVPTDFKKSTHCGYCSFKDKCWNADPLEDVFPEYANIDPATHKALLDQATVMARALYASTEERYVSSLRHIYRNIDSLELKQKLIDEIQTITPFKDTF